MTCPILFPSSLYYGLLLRHVPVPSPSCLEICKQEGALQHVVVGLIGLAQDFYIYFSYYWEGGEKKNGVGNTSAVAGTVWGSFRKHIWLEITLGSTLY